MKRFRAIIQTTKEPEDPNVIWYYKGELRHFDDGIWKPLIDVEATDVTIDNISNLPNITNLSEAIEYLSSKSYEYGIVNTLDELNNMNEALLKDGAHYYINNEKKTYIYSASSKSWSEDTNSSNSTVYIYSDRALVTNVNTSSNKIALNKSNYGDRVFYIAYDTDVSSISEVHTCKLELRGDSWYMEDYTVAPKVGQYVNIIATDRGKTIVPVIEETTEVSGETGKSIKLYENTVNVEGESSIFEYNIDIRLELDKNSTKISELYDWSLDVNSKQADQDYYIQQNATRTEELNAKIDAKVIEVGGVPFDAEPTEGSKNAVFSGGVYSYIKNKFVVMSLDDYNSMSDAEKKEDVFYFIIEEE